MDDQIANLSNKDITDTGSLYRQKLNQLWDALDLCETVVQFRKTERRMKNALAVYKKGNLNDALQKKFDKNIQDFKEKSETFSPGISHAFWTGKTTREVLDDPEYFKLLHEFDEYLRLQLEIISDILHKARILAYDENSTLNEEYVDDE